MEDPWVIRPDGIDLRVRVTPRGGRDAIEGVERLSDGRAVLKVRVREVPEAGAANAAVAKILAGELDVRASAVSLTAGAQARVKTFRIAGGEETLLPALAALKNGRARERG
jgi:uncharacterized protein YggU (UPF0235/DUF167 family)